tara:strand:+ start:2797 stop:3843 length:1047 start_codon:yes stop_codon:yes gene_type:complete
MAMTASAAPLFENNEVIELGLEYDIARLQAEKEDLRENGLAGIITLHENRVEIPVQVLTRGAGSFDCDQPQLKIKFSKDFTKKTVFEKLKKVKLFTKGTCLENKTDDEQDKQILANYLIYKLYEQMTDFSFKTRLLKINYKDRSGEYEDYTQYGFFLEPRRNIEKRLDIENIDVIELQNTLKEKVPQNIDLSLVSLVNAFEFIIANYDYGISGFFSHIINDGGYPDIYYGEKNSKIYQAENGQYIPLIYDFDISRFGYFAEMCTFGYAFFTNDIGMEMDCSVEKLKAHFEKDLSKFKYKDDVLKKLPTLLKGLKNWREENRKLIKKLGAAYNSGLDNFIRILELKSIE